MTLQDTIKEELKNAMRVKDKLRMDVLRSLLAGFVNEVVAQGQKPDTPITDDMALKVIKKLLKQRKEAGQQFKAGGRDDLAEKELKEAEIIEEFMPEQMSEDEIKVIAQGCMQETDASAKSDFGKVMPCVMKKVEGRADGSTVKAVLESLLQ